MKHDEIFCPYRRKRVALTPEEHVRQWFLARLVNEYGYPQSLISVEKPIQGRRYDAVVYSPQLEPKMLLEFKREDVALTQAVLDQAACYNYSLNVPYLVLCNGPHTLIGHVVGPAQLEYLSSIPQWTQLLS